MKYIYIIIPFLFLSCASRKVTVSNLEIKKDSVSQIETKVVTKEVSNIEIQNNILIDEFIIKPLDSTKEIVIDGKSYKNVVLTYKKTKDNSLHRNNKNVYKDEQKQQKTVSSVIKKEFKKEIDKKANYWVYLWLLIIPIGYYLYVYLKKKAFKI